MTWKLHGSPVGITDNDDLRVRQLGEFLESKIGGIVNVREFGAEGGSSPDTAAFQAWLTKAQTAGGYQVVPNGTYVIDDTLTINPAGNETGPDIELDFRGVTLVFTGDGVPLFDIDQSGTSARQRRIRFIGGRFLGSATATACFYCQDVNSATWTDCVVLNFTVGWAWLFVNTSSFSENDCLFNCWSSENYGSVKTLVDGGSSSFARHVYWRLYVSGTKGPYALDLSGGSWYDGLIAFLGGNAGSHLALIKTPVGAGSVISDVLTEQARADKTIIGSVAAAGTTFTRSSGSTVFTTDGSDVGRRISVPGAGAAAATLETRIASVTSTTVCELRDAATTEATGVSAVVHGAYLIENSVNATNLPSLRNINLREGKGVLDELDATGARFATTKARFSTAVEAASFYATDELALSMPKGGRIRDGEVSLSGTTPVELTNLSARGAVLLLLAGASNDMPSAIYALADESSSGAGTVSAALVSNAGAGGTWSGIAFTVTWGSAAAKPSVAFSSGAASGTVRWTAIYVA